MENESQNIDNIEQAVSFVEQEIEKRQTQIERENNIEEEAKSHDLIHQILGEKYFDADKKNLRPVLQKTDSYLSILSEEDALLVNELIDLAEKKGIKTAIAEAGKYSDFIMDAFHDSLVKRVHDSLKKK